MSEVETKLIDGLREFTEALESGDDISKTFRVTVMTNGGVICAHCGRLRYQAPKCEHCKRGLGGMP